MSFAVVVISTFRVNTDDIVLPKTRANNGDLFMHAANRRIFHKK